MHSLAARLVKPVPFSEASSLSQEKWISALLHHPHPPGIHVSPLAPSAHVTPTTLLSITAAILVNTHSVAAHKTNPVSLSGGERVSCDCGSTTELFSASQSSCPAERDQKAASTLCNGFSPDSLRETRGLWFFFFSCLFF